MRKTIAEINEKIKKGEAAVVTAEEIIDLVAEKGLEEAAREVDVITTGTFGPMCSSGAFLNLGHPKPRIKINRAWLNDVPAYAGIAAVDVYLGAAETAENDPLNSVFPGEFRYGGGHVIQELVAGKKVRLRAEGYGTDCYPNRRWETEISLDDMGEAWLYNPRNSYQNYNVGVNLSDRIIYTYMGVLRPRLGNANYSSAGQLSPLLNDPFFRTVGIGSRIFLGGSVGYVAGHGTQHHTDVPRLPSGSPSRPAGTLAVTGDLRGMSPRFLVGYSMLGYGATLAVGLGIPIPVLDQEVVRAASVSDEDLVAPVVDYSNDYPQGTGKVLGEVTYAELKSGKINIDGREVVTSTLSSYHRAREIAAVLKEWIASGRFLLAQPVELLPCEARPVGKGGGADGQA
ncbi:MAG: homocysteine biosynthesis protein [Actinomycetota bacterium]